MKSFLLFAVLFASYLANVKAGCDEAIVQTMNSCVKIRTEARDSFCITKQDELSKCNCVYDTIINACYDYCLDEPSIQTAKQQLDADIKSHCAAANLDPMAIPANVYNDIIETNNNDNYTTGTTGATTNNNNNGNTNTAGNTTIDSNQNQANAQSNVGDDDVNSGAQTNKLCFALLVANLLLATLLF